MSCIAIVDPTSTGAYLALEGCRRGYRVIAVWDSQISNVCRKQIPEGAQSAQIFAHVDECTTLAETAAALQQACRGLSLAAVIVGSESGVTLADALSEVLGLRTNSTAFGIRRNKSVQQQLVAKTGLRAVREVCSTEWTDVAAFIATEDLPVILKPVESAGSEGVKLCHTVEAVHDHFDLLLTSQRLCGAQGAAVLCQEFLRGSEYVVDHVSRDGVHRTVMVYRYDKRPANGSQFVYFGMLPVPCDSDIARSLIHYCRSVLDAIGIRNGPTHGEFVMTSTGPCLVEINCRAHGGCGNFLPLAKALTGGYTHVDVSLDAFLDEASFLSIPDVPVTPFQASGQLVFLVCNRVGTVVGMPGFEKIRSLESFVSLESSVSIGSEVTLTVDLFTAVGSCVLLHADPSVLQRDVETVRCLEIEGALFQIADVTPASRLRTCSEEAQQCNLSQGVFASETVLCRTKCA